jgi:hypothetical protein
MMRFPCVVETRLTFDRGDRAGMHCDYPLGLFNNVQYEGQKFEVDRGRLPISVQLEFRPGWAAVLDVANVPMTKFRPPECVEPDYREYRFYSHGKLYILEFRFDSIPEESD